MEKQLIIFDADGTLTNTNHHFVSAYLEAFRQMGCTVDAQKLLSMIGMGHDQAIPLLTSAEWYKKHGEEVVEKAKKIYLEQYLKQTQLFAGAKEVVMELRRRGKILALASSSQRLIVDYYLTLFPEASETFSVVVSFDDVKHSKPHPELFLKVLHESNVSPKKSCTVGDSAWDMLASKRAGIDAIAVLSGGTEETELRKNGAKEVYKDVLDLLHHLDSSLISARFKK